MAAIIILGELLCVNVEQLPFQSKDILELIHFDRHPHLPRYVKCDRLKLRQVLKSSL